MLRNVIEKSKKIQLKINQNKIFLKYLHFVFEEKLFMIIVSQINFLHKLYSYEQYKRPINIRILKNSISKV